MPGFVYGFMPLDTAHHAALGAALQGTALVGLGLWLAPRVLREHRDSIELAERASQLTQRVETLTQTRHGGGMLRAEVTGDGAGGADSACGTGLAGVEHRLATSAKTSGCRRGSARCSR
jgi:hypothetical protein